MEAMVLAAGKGTRLFPLTGVIAGGLGQLEIISRGACT